MFRHGAHGSRREARRASPGVLRKAERKVNAGAHIAADFPSRGQERGAGRDRLAVLSFRPAVPLVTKNINKTVISFARLASGAGTRRRDGKFLLGYDPLDTLASPRRN